MMKFWNKARDGGVCFSEWVKAIVCVQLRLWWWWGWWKRTSSQECLWCTMMRRVCIGQQKPQNATHTKGGTCKPILKGFFAALSRFHSAVLCFLPLLCAHAQATFYRFSSYSRFFLLQRPYVLCSPKSLTVWTYIKIQVKRERKKAFCINGIVHITF